VWADAPATPDGYRDRVIRCLWEYGGGLPVGFANEYLVRQGIESLSVLGCKERVGAEGSHRNKQQFVA
jgi:hypothetical protein